MSTQALSSRTEQLRRSLEWSHQVSQEACKILDHYCNQLSDLERIVQPVVFKTQSLIQTRENIKQARAQAEEVLDHLDASRKVAYAEYWQKQARKPLYDNCLAHRWSQRYFKDLTRISGASWLLSASLTQLSLSCNSTGDLQKAQHPKLHDNLFPTSL